MKSIILKKTGRIENLKKNLIFDELPEPEINKDEVLVKIHYAALNHRDLWIAKGLYSGIKLPIILGSDCVGTIHKLGKNVNGLKTGDKVIINPSLDWGDDESFHSDNYRILGMPDNGTLSEFIKINKAYIYKKPHYLNLEQASAIPLAGLTAYRALFIKVNVSEKDNILLTGIGGGVSTFALLFALKIKANVYVTSGSDDKIKRAVELGAKGGVNYKNENWDKEISKISNGRINIIIDSAGGDAVSKSLDIINYGGKIISFGATTGGVRDFEIRKVFWKQISLIGTTMGSDKDFRNMVEFVNDYRIEPIIDEIFSAKDIVKAFEKMNSANQFGKIIIEI